MLNTQMKSDKIAILGGSFDPPHLGHINLFHNISTLTDITELYIIPANESNFKRGRHNTTFDQKMEMLNLAILDYSDLYPLDTLSLFVSSYEGEKGGVSYTSDTIKHFFSETEDNGKVNFIIGLDIISTLDKWHDWEYLKHHVRFWCFDRDEGEKREIEGAEIIYVDSPINPSSSSLIREGNREMLSPSVREYIEENELYRSK